MLQVIHKYPLLQEKPGKSAEVRLKLPPGSKFLSISSEHTLSYVHVLEPVLTEDEQGLKEERILEIYGRDVDIHEIPFGGARDFVGMVSMSGHGYEGYVFDVILPF